MLGRKGVVLAQGTQNFLRTVLDNGRLGALPEIAAMRDKTGQAGAYLSKVGETLGLVREGLPQDKALIGFAGAPWTVATYMIEGGSSDRTGARTYAYTNPDDLRDLLDEHFRGDH